MKNYIKLPDTVHDYTAQAGQTGADGANTIDNDFLTSWDASCGKDGTIYLTSLHTFAVAQHIKKIVAKLWLEVHTQSGSSSDTGYSQCYIYIKQGGAWDLLEATIYTVSCSGDCNQTLEVNINLDVDYENVTDIKAFAYGQNRHDSGGGGGSNIIKIYEIQAFGDSKDYATII